VTIVAEARQAASLKRQTPLIRCRGASPERTSGASRIETACPSPHYSSERRASVAKSKPFVPSLHLNRRIMQWKSATDSPGQFDVRPASIGHKDAADRSASLRRPPRPSLPPVVLRHPRVSRRSRLWALRLPAGPRLLDVRLSRQPLPGLVRLSTAAISPARYSTIPTSERRSDGLR
jgi:hypothetical protein